jgi:NAD(P)-dependent dehydrogenase (short-subunit alcohol dehydrogenase family)
MRVLVTGAASGIGRATCLRLARDAKAQGRAGKIAAVDLATSSGLDGVVAELKALGAPGMVRTGMTAKVYADQRIAAERDALVPLGRVATPEDMADVVAFLLGQDSRYINGHDLVVDGGVAGNFLGRLPGLSQITRS